MGAPFVVVLSVLVLMSMYTLSMSVRSKSASQQTRKAQSMETCEELLQLALKDALGVVRRSANDPAHPLFLPLREDGGGTLPTLTLNDLAYASAEFAAKPGFSLDDLQVSIVRWKKSAAILEEAVSYEAVGVLKFYGEVSGTLGSTASHEFEIDFRTVLAAASQPFDGFTFFLGKTDALLREGAFQSDPNVTIDFAVSTMAAMRVELEKNRDGIPPVLADLRRLRRKAVKSKHKRKLDAAIQAFEQMLLSFTQALQVPNWPADPDWTVLDAGQPIAGKPNTVHRFGLPTSIFSRQPVVNLTHVDLPSQVGPPVQAWMARTPNRDSAAQAVRASEATAESDPMSMVAPLKQFLDIFKQDAGDLHLILEAYKGFQERFEEISGPDRETMILRARRLYASEVRTRATFVFEGPGKAKEAAEFLAVRPPPIGLVFVNDPTEPLRIDVQGLTGRLVIFAGQNVEVDGATVSDRNQDALVIIANGSMRVSAPEVHAGLVSLTGRYLGPGTSFHGSLLLGNLANRAAIDSALKGTIERMDSLSSRSPGSTDPNPSPTSILAVLGPVPLYKWSDR